MSTTLFRAEALTDERNALQGTPVCTLGPGPRWLTATAVLASLAFVAFACWGRYTRSEHVSGTLEPSLGLVRIHTPQAGTVIERRVREGQAVRRGDVLLVLSSERASLQTGEAQAGVMAQLDKRSQDLAREREAQAQIDTLAIQSLDARLRSLQVDAGHVQAEAALLRQRIAMAQATAARHSELVAQQFETAAALQPHLEAVLEQKARLEQAERALSGLQRDAHSAELELQAARLRRDNNGSSLGRQRAELAQLRTEADLRRSVVVTAPADGQVTALVAEIGQTVDPAATLMLLLPQGAELQARLWLPSRAIGFVHPQQPVRLRYQAFPYQHFGQHEGQVVEISRAPLDAAATPATTPPNSTREALYRVTVRLPAQQLVADGRPLALQAGMALDADIRVDSRRLIEWLLDPLRPLAMPTAPV
ncbi:MAG TPA: HlyD family efflux transporter periplasmic adaptor subunit [Ideonella sp.]|nr:HlyD family efflux transporter periplasmic adaptor subunit [Ideonella sp.]